MNLISILKKDHRTVEGIFARIKKAKQPKERTALFATLWTEFHKHATGEEEAVYPKMERLTELEGKTSHSYKEHEEARAAFKRVEKFSPDTDAWMKAVKDLEKDIAHHVREEEEAIFPRMQELFTEAQLREMGREFKSVKARRKAA